MAKTNEASADNEQTATDQSGVGYGSTATKAIAAAAATGAATYAVRRALSHRGTNEASEEKGVGEPDRDEPQDEKSEESVRRRMSVKKDDLAETLTSKASEVKNAAARLRPGKDQSVAAIARNAVSDSLLPFAEEAAAAAGKAAAEKAPAAVRDKLIPRFIEGFEESH